MRKKLVSQSFLTRGHDFLSPSTETNEWPWFSNVDFGEVCVPPMENVVSRGHGFLSPFAVESNAFRIPCAVRRRKLHSFWKIFPDIAVHERTHGFCFQQTICTGNWRVLRKIIYSGDTSFYPRSWKNLTFCTSSKEFVGGKLRVYKFLSARALTTNAIGH